MEKKTKHILIGIAIFIVILLSLAFVAGMIIFVLKVYTPISYGVKPTPVAPIAQDKSVCASSRIELLNYDERYSSIEEASGDLQIKFAGKTLTCQQGQIDRGETSCPIGLKDSNQCMQIMVTENWDQCYITGLVDCG